MGKFIGEQQIYSMFLLLLEVDVTIDCQSVIAPLPLSVGICRGNEGLLLKICYLQMQCVLEGAYNLYVLSKLFHLFSIFHDQISMFVHLKFGWSKISSNELNHRKFYIIHGIEFPCISAERNELAFSRAGKYVIKVVGKMVQSMWNYTTSSIFVFYLVFSHRTSTYYFFHMLFCD